MPSVNRLSAALRAADAFLLALPDSPPRAFLGYVPLFGEQLKVLALPLSAHLAFS